MRRTFQFKSFNLHVELAGKQNVALLLGSSFSEAPALPETWRTAAGAPVLSRKGGPCGRPVPPARRRLPGTQARPARRGGVSPGPASSLSCHLAGSTPAVTARACASPESCSPANSRLRASCHPQLLTSPSAVGSKADSV